MVVSNHPLASTAGAEMLAAGGNAIDAAIATLFALTVVEPMMVGIIGGGMAHIRTSDGSHRFVDVQSTVPLAVRPDTYTSKPGSAHDVFDTTGDENLNGPKAVAVPGSLKAWCETLQRFGTMSLAMRMPWLQARVSTHDRVIRSTRCGGKPRHIGTPESARGSRLGDPDRT